MEHASIPKSHGDKMFFSLKMGSLQLARRCWKNSKCCTTCVRCRCRCWCCWHLSCLFLGNFCSQLVLQTTTDGFWVSRSQFNHMDSYVQFWHLQNSILSTKLDFERNKQMGGLFKRRFCPFFPRQEKLGNFPTTRVTRSGDHRLRTFGLCKVPVMWPRTVTPQDTPIGNQNDRGHFLVDSIENEWSQCFFFGGGNWRWIYAYDMSYDIE